MLWQVMSRCSGVVNRYGAERIFTVCLPTGHSQFTTYCTLEGCFPLWLSASLSVSHTLCPSIVNPSVQTRMQYHPGFVQVYWNVCRTFQMKLSWLWVLLLNTHAHTSVYLIYRKVYELSDRTTRHQRFLSGFLFMSDLSFRTHTFSGYKASLHVDMSHRCTTFTYTLKEGSVAASGCNWERTPLPVCASVDHRKHCCPGEPRPEGDVMGQDVSSGEVQPSMWTCSETCGGNSQHLLACSSHRCQERGIPAGHTHTLVPKYKILLDKTMYHACHIQFKVLIEDVLEIIPAFRLLLHYFLVCKAFCLSSGTIKGPLVTILQL